MLHTGTRLRLSYDWDEALLAEWALAPRDLVDAGQITEELYVTEWRRLNNFVRNTIGGQLPKLGGKGMRIEIPGHGLLRDLPWVPRAVRMGYEVGMTDGSLVACFAARIWLRHQSRLSKKESQQVVIRHALIEEAWETGAIDESKTVAYYAGQFIQNQDPDIMHDMMERMGRFVGLPGRVVWLLHPLGEDNDPEKVQWRHTIPYTEAELREPLEAGLGGKVAMDVLGKHDHYHQHYTLFRITRA